MIYLNHAATSYPKPDCVLEAYNEAVKSLPSAQFRSAGILDNGDLFADTKANLGRILGISDAQNIHFTSGSTEGLNHILFGLGLRAAEFMTTTTEHNSVLRPLFNMTPGEEPVVVACRKDGTVGPDQIAAALEAADRDEFRPAGKRIRALVINHCSNVTGAVADLAAIGRLTKERGILLIVDVSQSAGCIPIHADEWGIDALAFTGHKSLLGMQGTGGYYVRRGIALRPLLFGGSGVDSRRIHYEETEYEYEVGTQNSYGIAALRASTDYILNKGIDAIHQRENQLADYLIQGLRKIPGVHIYGEGLRERGPLVSITMDGLGTSDLGYILQSSYDIITRAGLQCAPLIHEQIGAGKDGTLRISFSDETDVESLDQVLAALTEVAAAVGM